MVLVSRRGLVFLFLVPFSAFIVLGILGYTEISRSSGAGEAHTLFQAQRFLYFFILLAAGFVIVYIRLLIKSRKIFRELDRLLEISRVSSLPPEAQMKKLGVFGEKMAALYRQLNILNEKRSLKISAMTDLIDFLTANMQMPLIISDVFGKILHTSRIYLDRAGKTRSEIIGISVEKEIPEVVLPEILLEIEKYHASVDVKVKKGYLNCYPVDDRNNALSYLVFIFAEKPPSISFQPGKAKPSQKQGNRNPFGKALSLFNFGKKTR